MRHILRMGVAAVRVLVMVCVRGSGGPRHIRELPVPVGNHRGGGGCIARPPWVIRLMPMVLVMVVVRCVWVLLPRIVL